MAKVDRREKRLREPLDIDEKCLVLGERLRKRMLQEDYTKAQPKTKLFLTEINFYNINNVKTKQQYLFVLASTKAGEK